MDQSMLVVDASGQETLPALLASEKGATLGVYCEGMTVSLTDTDARRCDIFGHGRSDRDGS